MVDCKELLTNGVKQVLRSIGRMSIILQDRTDFLIKLRLELLCTDYNGTIVIINYLIGSMNMKIPVFLD